MPAYRPAIERFLDMAMPEPNSGCWLWEGSVDEKGYGFFNAGKRQYRRAHRWSYTHFNGPIPDGLEIDHLCSVRCCVNPDHLEAVTHEENVRRGSRWANKSDHCGKGHRFDDENKYTNQGRRYCRACATIRMRRHRRTKKIASSTS